MPEVGSESAVEFSDWLYETEQAIGSLSDKASMWFAACLELARRTYRDYVNATPLERLALDVTIPEELRQGQWARLEKKTMTLLLGSMTKVAKDDVITYRVRTVPGVLYRLHVLYQPGGAAERTAILRQLEGTPGGEGAHECITTLRKWRRYLQRADEMGVAIPDASILLRSVEVIIARTLDLHGEVKFRLSLVKNELQLQSRPTTDNVIRFYNHALAELQQAAPTRGAKPTTSTTTETTKIKAVGNVSGGTGEATSPRSPGARRGGKTPCKFFQSDAGCKRGQQCKFEHTFEGKEAKRSRCWECGATTHRRPDCPVALKNKSTKNAKGEAPMGGGELATSSTSTSLNAMASVQAAKGAAATQQAILESTQQATRGSTSSTTSTTTGNTQDEARTNEVKALLQEANAMLSKLTKLAPMQLVTDESIKELSAVMGSLGFPEEECAALLDTGASHSFRKPVDGHEEQQALPVRVELASGQFVTLRQNKGGTLLATKEVQGATEASTILPLGALVQQLGCDLSWTRRGGLKVTHPQFGELKTFVKGNHPMIGETQALDLIAQLEELKLKEFNNNMAETYVKMMDSEKAKTWDVSMAKYVQTGQRSHALEALVGGSSPLGTLDSSLASLVALDIKMDVKNAWSYLKALPIRRSLRKTMMQKRWAVRLFAQENDEDLKALDNGDVIFVDINTNKSRWMNMKGDSAVYRALLWAALNGRLEGVFGSIPANQAEELRCKMMWLWMVAKAVNHDCGLPAPFLAMSGKSMETFWKGEQWKAFQYEYQIPLVQNVDPETGCTALVATNLGLSKVTNEDESMMAQRQQRSYPSRTWTPGFNNNFIEAVKQWRTYPFAFEIQSVMKKIDGPLEQMTEAERNRWLRHIRNGHLPFEKRCKTCIETAATGRAHRRVIAPSCYVLSMDLCGPFRTKGEYAGAKGYKYALIGAYVMPKIAGYKDVPLPEGDPEEEAMLEEDDLLDEVDGQDEPMDPQDKEELKKSQERYDELLKGIGDTMQYQVLHYAVPLKTRLMGEVSDAVKSLYLQLRAEGLPVTRVHSDRARELRGRDLRAWLLHRDVLPTCGESQVPQTNGRAESAVKQAKRRTKTLLTATGLPRVCWPWAMSFAAHQQREFALGRGGKVIPFGSPVHVKNKVFGTGHKYDLDNRWKEGVYVGPAPDIRHGHTVRFPEGRYVSSMHLRKGVVDTDEMFKLEEVEMDLPSPSRRLRRKTASTRTAEGPGVGGGPDNLPAEDSDPRHAPPGDVLERDEGYGALGEEDADLEFPVDWLDGPVQFDRLDDLPAEDSGPHHAPPGSVLDLEEHVRSGVPLRRVTTKSSLRSLRPLSGPEQEAESLATKLQMEGDYSHEAVLSLYGCLERARQLFSRSRTRRPSTRTTSWFTGMFAHGGVCGLRDGAKRLPSVTQYLTKFAKDVAGIKRFGAVGIVRNSSLGCHRDLHNNPGSHNAVYPISGFSEGGIWVQGDPEEDEPGVWKQVRPGVWKQGVIKKFVDGQPLYFSPRLWHEVQPHGNGDRVVLVAYSPRSTNLQKGDFKELQRLGVPIEEAVPEGGLKINLIKKDPNEAMEESFTALNEANAQVIEDLQERAQALRWLLEEEQALAEDLQDARDVIHKETTKVMDTVNDMMKSVEQSYYKAQALNAEACLRAMELHEEPDYEELIRNLEGDLQVVHTVPLSQVRAAPEKWVGAIKKELNNLFESGTLRRISYKEAKALQQKGLLRLVPSKGVHTIKPPEVPGQVLRRKYRLVLCGNHAAKEEDYGSLYAGGASIETFRAALTYATSRQWRGATSDITGAFLLADWPETLSRYAVQPPRFLIEQGYVPEGECWLVEKPLYGLRESPSIWSSHRSSRLASAKIPYNDGFITLRPSKIDKEIWLAFDEQGVEQARGSLVALLVTYVDDLFFLGQTPVVLLLDEWIRKEWPCSALQWADSADGTRYLGTEVYQRATGAFELKQTGYIEDLLRAYEMTDACPTKLPCPKEWIAEDFESYVEEHTEMDLKQGQRCAGELLWLTMRSRPDLQFVVGHMAQWVSKHPKRIERIAKRVLAYLAGTKEMKLILGEFDTSNSSSNAQQTTTNSSGSPQHTSSAQVSDMKLRVIAYSDASFAPTGSRSYGASLVTICGSPISWKAARQAMTTLSTMEAELLEATNAAVLAEGLGCLLDEICGYRLERVLRVDNSAATAMLQGGPGSWRTRHLRVRSSYVIEAVERDQLRVEFVEGLKQLADLGTKSHPKARMWELLRMWGFENLPAEAVQARAAKALMICLVMLALDSVPVAEATEEKEPLRLAGWDELFMVVLACCIIAVLVWELVKWAGRCLYTRAVQGKKAHRLKRMRDLAKAAVESELDRAWDVPQEALSGRSPHQRVQQAMTGAMTRAIDSAPVMSEGHVPRTRMMKNIGIQTENLERPLDVPDDEYFRFNGPFYMTEHGKNIHVRQDCHGFRLASHRVKPLGFCDWCEGAVPLYVRRERVRSSGSRLR